MINKKMFRLNLDYLRSDEDVLYNQSSLRWIKLHQLSVLNEFIGPSPNRPKLTAVNLRVAILLLCKLKEGNLVRGSQESFARELGISPQAISKAMGALENLEFLIRQGGRGITRKIMINPNFASIGAGTNTLALLRRFQELQHKRQLERTKDAQMTNRKHARPIIR